MPPPPDPAVVEEDGPPRTEVEQLQFKINETTDEVSVFLWSKWSLDPKIMVH